MAIIKRPKRPSYSRCRTPICCAFLAALCIWIFVTIPSEENTLNQPVLLHLDNIRPENVLENRDYYLYPRVCGKEEKPTIEGVANCYPDAPLQPMPASSACTKIENWTNVQHCLVGRRQTLPDREEVQLNRFQIHVIGERNSGTKWLQQELAKCFRREELGVRCHRDFLRSKHFFQPPSRGNFDYSIVIVIVRDPIQWVAAMREKPYHMPYHMDGFDMSNPNKMPVIPLDWQEFIKRASPWAMSERSQQDRQILQEGAQGKVTCVQDFKFNEVVPCRFDNETIPKAKWRGHEPVYELQRDGSGEPFEDLLKLRSEKIKNFILEVPLLMRLAGFSAVRYEDLLRQGTRPFLEHIAAMMGMKELPEVCKPLPPQVERLGHRAVPEGLQKWVEDHLVLDTEQLLGYR